MSDKSLREAVEALRDESREMAQLYNDYKDDTIARTKHSVYSLHYQKLDALLAVLEPSREELREKVANLLYIPAGRTDCWKSREECRELADRILALIPAYPGASGPPSSLLDDAMGLLHNHEQDGDAGWQAEYESVCTRYEAMPALPEADIAEATLPLMPTSKRTVTLHDEGLRNITHYFLGDDGQMHECESGGYVMARDIVALSPAPAKPPVPSLGITIEENENIPEGCAALISEKDDGSKQRVLIKNIAEPPVQCSCVPPLGIDPDPKCPIHGKPPAKMETAKERIVRVLGQSDEEWFADDPTRGLSNLPEPPAPERLPTTRWGVISCCLLS